MTETNKISMKELEGVTGGAGGAGRGEWKTVCGLQSGCLAILTAPAASKENEINHTGLLNGDKVQIAGSTVKGTGFGGAMVYYTWVYVPKYGVSGYVNSAYIR